MKKKARQNEKQATPVAKAEPVTAGASLPSPQPKRRGRPRKNPLSHFEMPNLDAKTVSLADAKKPGKDLEGKALVSFRRAMADAEKAMMTPEGFDGGGTDENAPAVTKESLQRRVTRRLNVIDRFLTDDKLIELLSFSSLKEVGIYEGILLDKSLVLQGQPNVIIGNDDRNAMSALLPRLLQELKRRNLIASASQAVTVEGRVV